MAHGNLKLGPSVEKDAGHIKLFTNKSVYLKECVHKLWSPIASTL